MLGTPPWRAATSVEPTLKQPDRSTALTGGRASRAQPSAKRAPRPSNSYPIDKHHLIFRREVSSACARRAAYAGNRRPRCPRVPIGVTWRRVAAAVAFPSGEEDGRSPLRGAGLSCSAPSPGKPGLGPCGRRSLSQAHCRPCVATRSHLDGPAAVASRRQPRRAHTRRGALTVAVPPSWPPIPPAWPCPRTAPRGTASRTRGARRPAAPGTRPACPRAGASRGGVPAARGDCAPS